MRLPCSLVRPNLHALNSNNNNNTVNCSKYVQINLSTSSLSFSSLPRKSNKKYLSNTGDKVSHFRLDKKKLNTISVHHCSKECRVQCCLLNINNYRRILKKLIYLPFRLSIKLCPWLLLTLR